MSQAFDYYKTHFAMTGNDYPYNFAFPMRAEKCLYDEYKATSCMVDDYTYAESGDVAMMKMALSHQPIAAAMNGEMMGFMTYQSGIFDDEKCESTLNHAILLIGYGHDQTGD